MNKKDLQQIEKLLDKKLKPIKQELIRHSHTLEAHSESLVIIEENVRILPDIASLIKEHSEKLKDYEEQVADMIENQIMRGLNVKLGYLLYDGGQRAVKRLSD